MPALLRAFNGRLGNRHAVPTGRLKIDRYHPLAQGLVACYVPGAMGGIDLCGNTPTLTLDTAAAFGVGSEGPGLKSTVANSGMYGTAPSILKTGTNFSLYFRGDVLGNSSAFCQLTGLTFDNASGSPFNVYAFDAGASGTTGGTSRLVWNNAGTADGQASSWALATGGIASLGMTLVQSATVTSALAYQNGLQTATGAGGVGAPTTSATTQISINTYMNVQTRFSNTTTFLTCFWNRILSASEMQLVDADPYGFLIPAEGGMPALLLPTVADVLFSQIWM